MVGCLCSCSEFIEVEGSCSECIEVDIVVGCLFVQLQ